MSQLKFYSGFDDDDNDDDEDNVDTLGCNINVSRSIDK